MVGKKAAHNSFILLSSLLFIGIFLLNDRTFSKDRSRVAEQDSLPNILVLLADDWSWPHAGIYPQSDKVIQTPAFDRIARNGVLFNKAYTAVPSCSPSRAAVLTGQYPHRLEEAANLWSSFPSKYPVYTRMLAQKGYSVGFTRMGWKPGNYKTSGWDHNPAGVRYNDFKTFFKARDKDQPFCFWFGSSDPHRPYERNSGVNSGMDLSKAKVPPYLPDNSTVRRDILDYYFEVERFDREAGAILDRLKKAGELRNTLVIMTSDNGWPFPRAKANLYDVGTHMPLAIMWADRLKGGQVYNNFINSVDIAPTILAAANIERRSQMNGRDILKQLKGQHRRYTVFTERERHAYVRDNNVGYPSRAVRSDSMLYIRNAKPDRWPAGAPHKVFAVGPFGDVDGSPTKDYIINEQKHMPVYPEQKGIEQYTYFELAFEKRPYEELYDLNRDPYELNNVAGDSAYKNELRTYRTMLDRWMKRTKDPRANGTAKFDQYPYYGGNGGQGNGFGNITGAPTQPKN